MHTKKCSKCGEVKALDDFYEERRASDGRQGSCRICRRKRRIQLYNANPARNIARTVAWQAANPAKVKAWRTANNEMVNALARARYASNPARVKAASAAWQAANPGHWKQKNLKNREIMSNAYLAKIMRITVALLPQDLIEAKRAHLKLVRKLKELK